MQNEFEKLVFPPPWQTEEYNYFNHTYPTSSNLFFLCIFMLIFSFQCFMYNISTVKKISRNRFEAVFFSNCMFCNLCFDLRTVGSEGQKRQLPL